MTHDPSNNFVFREFILSLTKALHQNIISTALHITFAIFVLFIALFLFPFCNDNIYFHPTWVSLSGQYIYPDALVC